MILLTAVTAMAFPQLNGRSGCVYFPNKRRAVMDLLVCGVSGRFQGSDRMSIFVYFCLVIFVNFV